MICWSQLSVMSIDFKEAMYDSTVIIFYHRQKSSRQPLACTDYSFATTCSSAATVGRPNIFFILWISAIGAVEYSVLRSSVVDQ